MRTSHSTQLFVPVSSTYTYLPGCEETGLAVLIDPVVSMSRAMRCSSFVSLMASLDLRGLAAYPSGLKSIGPCRPRE